MKQWWVGIICGDVEEERRVARELARTSGGDFSIRFVPRLEVPRGESWVAGIVRGAVSDPAEAASSARAAGARAVYLIQRQEEAIPEALLQGQVDDVILLPLRPLELLSKFSHVEFLGQFEEISSLNLSVSGLVSSLKDDLQIVEALHRARQPRRFGNLKGFKVESRYLAGTRSGGDHFDVIDAKDGGQMSMILSDSSSFGLSSAVLSTLMRVVLRVSVNSPQSSVDTLKAIYDDVKLTLKERDQLSLFYGTISRKDYVLRYSHLGASGVYHSSSGGAFSSVPSQGNALTQSGFSAVGEAELRLVPHDRLALISDGFIEAAGGEAELKKLLARFRQEDSRDLLNELVFRVKSQMKNADDMPNQDCTAVVFDVDSKVLRLARA